MDEFKYRVRETYDYLHSVCMANVRDGDKLGAMEKVAEMHGMVRVVFTLSKTMNPGVSKLYSEMMSVYKTCERFVSNMD